MKKIFQITVIMLSALTMTNVAQAQAPTPLTPATRAGSSDQVELSVTLVPIQTLKVNIPNVNLVYATEANYKDGVSKTVENQLTVYSIGGFQVTVKSENPALKNTDSDVTIANEGIKITAGKGAENNLTYVLPAEVELSSTAAPIITSTNGVVDKKFNITYKGDGGESYISKYFKTDGAVSVYTTTVTYTIAAN